VNGTVSAVFRSSISCRSSAFVASICFAFVIRFEKVVRTSGFLFGAFAAFHCFPVLRNITRVEYLTFVHPVWEQPRFDLQPAWILFIKYPVS
jgi:hypothetical protein